MIPTVAPLYASLLAVVFVTLSARVILRRYAAKVSLGDAEDKTLRKRIRVHANFAEYAPFALLLLLMAELQGAPGWALHLLGLTLLVGRLIHAVGTGHTPQNLPMRQLGMVLTFVMILLTALGLIGHSLL